ncbi:hypothetical protein OROMI_017024 [Orobanche minor]
MCSGTGPKTGLLRVSSPSFFHLQTVTVACRRGPVQLLGVAFNKKAVYVVHREISQLFTEFKLEAVHRT